MNPELPRQDHWLVSPAVDLLVFANLGWLLLLVPGAVGRGDTVVDFWQVYFITLPHRWMTLLLVGLDSDRRDGRTFSLVLTAALLFVLIVGIYGGTGALTCLALVDFAWNAWHFAAQHAGILQIYARRRGMLTDGIDRWLPRLLITYAILRLPGWTRAEWLLELDWLAVGGFAWLLLREVLRPVRSGGRSAYLLSVSLLYSGIVLAVHFERGRLGLMLATASALFHATEYLAIVSDYAVRRRTVGSPGRFRWLAHNWFVFLGLYLVILGSLGAVLDSRTSGLKEFWLGLNVWAALTHYAFDGHIWKLRRPQTAGALGIGSPTAKGEPQ